jgi:hypothetical protein
MSRRSLLLLSAAAIGVAWLGWTAYVLSVEVHDLRARPRTLAVDRVAVPGAAAGEPAMEAPVPRPTMEGRTSAVPPPAPAPAVGGGASDGGIAVPVVGLARLAVKPASPGAEIRFLVHDRAIQPVRTADELAEQIGLDARQRAWAQQVVDETKGLLRDLRRLRNEDGRTWEEVQAEGVRMVDGAREVDDAAALAFRERLVPGSQETFGQAEDRILREARDRVREGLYADQNEAFDATPTDGMFGPRPPGAGVPLFYTVSGRAMLDLTSGR